MARPIILLALLCGSSLLAQELPKIELDNASEHIQYDQDLLTPEFHAARRQALRDSMPEGSVAVFFANPVRNRSNDVDFEYHQDPNFYYLSGHNEPHAVLFIYKEEQELKGTNTNEILFVQERNEMMETWTGTRLGPVGAEKVLEIKSSMNASEMNDLKGLFDNVEHVYAIRPKSDIRNSERDKEDLFSLVETFNLRCEKDDKEIDARPLVDNMSALREIKEEEELQLLRKAIDITCEAQKELMRALGPGMKEFETEAIVEYIFKSNGAEYPGFPTIHGSGPNTCVLHYISNRRPFTDNELLLSDIGAEYHGYTADVTRTIPVDGTYSPEEKVIYELVLKAQNAGIEESRAGNEFRAPHQAATKVITDGLMELGLIEKPEQVRRYFMHGTSHYLGLDVHDAGKYGPLEVNSVITVEPGIYISSGSDCDPKWWNIGVRIEDDILITEGDPEVLSASAPRTVEEIEALMKEDSVFSPVEKP